MQADLPAVGPTFRSGATVHDAGFSLVEAVVSAALLLLVIAAVFALADPTRGVSLVQLESADLEQRLRVAANTLSNDLTMAGAGTYAGADTGPLTFWFAPVLPYRRGRVAADSPGTFRSDIVTLFYVPSTSSQTTLSAALSSGQLTLQVAPESGCPQGQPLCGFLPGMTLLVHDSQGHFDTLTLTSTAGNQGQLAVNSPGGVMRGSYAIGSKVAQVIQRTYYVKPNAAQGVDQLVYYDGSTNADTPVIDHVAGIELQYYGDPQPPILHGSVSDSAGQSTTYGPKPPPLDARPTAYPDGENCVFTLDPVSGLHSPRLEVLGDQSLPRALVRLTAAELGDGDIWCPEVGAENRFDADLLRIRKVAVTLRVESAVDALRGPAGVLFRHGGTGRGGQRLLPDRELRFQVTPPNLNLRP